MKAKNLLVVIACTVLLAMPVAFAQTTITTTDIQFNIGQVVQFTLTLLGESGVASTAGGAATTDIVFNSTTGTDVEVQAIVLAGSTQTDAPNNAIFSYDNTGTVNLNVSIYLNASTPACIDLYGGTTNETTTAIGTGETTVVNDFTPAASAVEYWLKTNFTSCVQGDTTTRELTSNGTLTS